MSKQRACYLPTHSGFPLLSQHAEPTQHTLITEAERDTRVTPEITIAASGSREPEPGARHFSALR